MTRCTCRTPDQPCPTCQAAIDAAEDRQLGRDTYADDWEAA